MKRFIAILAAAIMIIACVTGCNTHRIDNMDDTPVITPYPANTIVPSLLPSPNVTTAPGTTAALPIPSITVEPHNTTSPAFR